MTAVSEDATADLNRRIAELEQRLELALIERDAAVERQTASALVNFRLQNELRATAECQKASAEILRTIANAPSDATRSLQQIAETCARQFGAPSVSIRLAENGEWTETHLFGDSATRVRAAVPLETSRIGGPNLPGTVVAENRQIHIPDLDNIDPAIAHWPGPSYARAAGTRTMCGTPLRREDKVIGVLIIFRDRLAPFTAEELGLQQSFADQAVIAIENARLFNESRVALERQTATAEILRVISQSPTDVKPVFDAIVRTIVRLLRCDRAFVMRCEGTSYVTVATAAFDGSFDELGYSAPIDPAANFPSRAILEKQTLYYPDWSVIELPDRERHLRETYGISCSLFLPLLRDQECIGLLALVGRQPAMFGDNEIALAESFRDQAVIAIENTRLFNETQEALERQTATADILKVIASSPSDVQPVFEAIAERSNKLVNGLSTAVLSLVDDALHLMAYTQVSPAADAALRAFYPQPLSTFVWGETVRRGEILRIPDSEDEAATPTAVREVARARGWRSAMFVPLLRDQRPIGAISVTRRETGPFADHHVQLLQTFADQAVIAIENTRLFNETREALERQTATAEILKVIASSPADVQPVFDAIATSANRLIGGFSTAVHRIIDDVVHLVAFTPIDPEADEALKAAFPVHLSEMPSVALVQNGETAQVADAETADPQTQGLSRARGWRSVTFTPLMNQGACIGFIACTRRETGVLADHHVQLLRTFADQAVIAIENTRLFNEVQARTNELTEALEQQTATSEVLSVISSSAGDLAPVFDAMLAKAMQLCSANFGVLNTYDGKQFHTAATYGLPPAYDEYRRRQPLEYGPGTAPARLLQGEPFVEIDNLPESEAYRSGDANRRALVDIGGARCLLAVPLLRDERVVGNVMIFRQENRPFSEKQITLLQQFAAQAVIAIENTRLLRELRQSTEDLSESLQQQTATSEVLQIISSSPSDLAPVFDKMLENATRVCGAEFGSMNLVEGDTFRRAALYNAPPAFAAARSNTVFPIHPQSSIAAVIRGKQVVQLEDMRNGVAYLARNPSAVELVELGGARTIVVVPMVREDEVIGVITVYRQEVRPFGDKQIDLLTNFARQAVIAIENARLLRELRQRTDDLSEALVYQTGSSNILKVIASSPTDVGPALEAIVESACEICDASDAVVFLKDGDDLVFAAHHGPIPLELERWPINRKWITGRALVDKVPQHLQDLNGPEGDDFPEARVLARHQGQRTVLSVPLLQEGEAIGVISLRRTEVDPFNDKQIELLKSFADQAVIAISNVRLFDEVQARTRELAKSLDDLRTAQDRLIQTEKLASLGQLTAGIAHEIKNPLNFVNNFAALSAELTDELNEALKPAVLDDSVRAEVDELTGTLKNNLDKVVQHGKRADSIVKNMLLHSREGSGEHRPADINALVDESLNLAYHGARAEKPHFNVTLQRNFDPEAGMIEVFPQEITRVFLNLISNGFYAVSKRKADHGDSSFEGVVTATTKGRTDHVEICIRDNGTGIPPDVKERMFNPFFTTKPAGEGTGLGLSMSHDIIVKQHGGTIDVDTLQGEFTEFTIILPRTSNLSNKSRG